MFYFLEKRAKKGNKQKSKKQLLERIAIDGKGIGSSLIILNGK